MPKQASNSASETSLHEDQPSQLQAAEASSPNSSPTPKRAKFGTPAQVGQHCQRLEQCTPATALPPFHQARLATYLPTSPAPPGGSHHTPKPRGAETPLEGSVTLPDSDEFDNGSAADALLAEADRDLPLPEVYPESTFIWDIVRLAIRNVRAWQSQYQRKIWGQEGNDAAKQYLSPQSAQLADMLSQVEAWQKRDLKHCPSRYCHFLKLRDYWYRLLGNQAVQLHHHALYHDVAVLATSLVVEWFRQVHQTLGTLLPVDSDAYPSQQAAVHGQVLPQPTLFPFATAVTEHASPAATGSRHEDLTADAEVASADQQPNADNQVRQAGCDPHPSARRDVVNLGFNQSSASETEQSETASGWVHLFPKPDCSCISCLAWQTCKQPPRFMQARDCRPYDTLPVGAMSNMCYNCTDELNVQMTFCLAMPTDVDTPLPVACCVDASLVWAGLCCFQV